MWQVDSRGGIIKVAKSTQTTPQQQLRARQQHFQLYQSCCLFLSKLLGKQEQRTKTTKKKPVSAGCGCVWFDSTGPDISCFYSSITALV